MTFGDFFQADMDYANKNVLVYVPENKTYSLTFGRGVIHMLVCHVDAVLFMGSTCANIMIAHNITTDKCHTGNNNSHISFFSILKG